MLLAVRRLCKPALLKSLKMFDPVAHPYNTYSLSSSQRMDCYSIIEQMGGLDAYIRVVVIAIYVRLRGDK